MRGVFTYDAPRPHDFHHQAICSGSGRARTFKQISPRHFSKVLAYLLAYASINLSSERDSNPHGISTTRLSFLRGYQLLHLTLCYRYGEIRTPNPFWARTSQARMYTFHHIPLYFIGLKGLEPPIRIYLGHRV